VPNGLGFFRFRMTSGEEFPRHIQLHNILELPEEVAAVRAEPLLSGFGRRPSLPCNPRPDGRYPFTSPVVCESLL